MIVHRMYMKAWTIDIETSYHIVHAPHLYTKIILNITSKVVLPNREMVDVSHVGAIS